MSVLLKELTSEAHWWCVRRDWQSNDLDMMVYSPVPADSWICPSVSAYLYVSQHLQLCHHGWWLPQSWLVLTHAAVVVSGRTNHSLGVSFLCSSVILTDTYCEAILRAILKPFAVHISGKVLRHFEINLYLWHHWLKMRCLLVLAILQLLFI